MKSGLKILIGAPEVPFLIPPKWPKYPVLAILRVSKMALWMPESKFRDHFSIQTSPQNPQKATSGTKIGPRKVIFGNFFNLGGTENGILGAQIKILRPLFNTN